MSLLEAVILGIIQGLTEFLPISSSGHLELAKWIFPSETLPEDSLLMTVVLHFATALSTIFVFRKDIAEIIRGIFQFKWNEEFRFSIKVIVSMVPAALVGVLLDEEIEAFFGGQYTLVGCMLLVTGVVLFLADRAKDTGKPVSFMHAFLVGVSQAIAILPGISRSGATISTAVLLGIDRSKAARFSFLMVVPLIFGKMAKDLLDDQLATTTIDYSSLLTGFVAAFLTGMVACTWMIKLVKKSKLTYFSVYCFVVGGAAIVFSLV